MDPLLLDQVRYLELRLAGCKARPELHRYQIHAYEHQLALARSVSTALAYLRAMESTGTTMEVMRAEWIDRYANWGRIYRALGHDAKARAAAINDEAAQDARGPHDFADKVTRAKLESTRLHQAADASVSALPSLLTTLLDWATDAHTELGEEHRLTVAAFWAIMRENDPLCTWQRICEHPPYRQRIPFDDARLHIIGGWLREALGKELCDEPPGSPQAAPASAQDADLLAPDAMPDAMTNAAHEQPGPLEVPTAAQAALAYHMTYEALDRNNPRLDSTRKVYERIFEIEAASGSGPTFLRRMAEENMYTRLAREPQLATASEALDHCQGLSQPHMEHHYRALLDALQTSHSPTEVEYEIERLGECFATESAWSNIFLCYATKAIMAVSAYALDRSEPRRKTVRASYGLVCELFGKDWNAMLESPRIRDFFCKVMFARGQQIAPAQAPSPGALAGEVGFPTIEGIREVTMWRAMEEIQKARIDPGEYMARVAKTPPFATPEELRAHLTALFHEAMAGKPDVTPGPASSQELVLWGQRVHLDDLLKVLASPPRPEVELA